MTKSLTEQPDYYQLELDDMVIALHNKDEQIERLQEQLNEANNIVKHVIDFGCCGKDKINRYLEKWGVK